MNNYRYLTSLAYRWNREKNYTERTFIKFVRRAQTSLLQYDEHNRQLWFTYDRTLCCLNLDSNRLDCSYTFLNDDILCYKIYNDHFICAAHGNLLTVICQQTKEFYPCQINPQLERERDDVLSLDVFSNDQERYLMLSGSRDHTVSSK